MKQTEDLVLPQHADYLNLSGLAAVLGQWYDGSSYTLGVLTIAAGMWWPGFIIGLYTQWWVRTRKPRWYTKYNCASS